MMAGFGGPAHQFAALKWWCHFVAQSIEQILACAMSTEGNVSIITGQKCLPGVHPRSFIYARTMGSKLRNFPMAAYFRHSMFFRHMIYLAPFWTYLMHRIDVAGSSVIFTQYARAVMV